MGKGKLVKKHKTVYKEQIEPLINEVVGLCDLYGFPCICLVEVDKRTLHSTWTTHVIHPNTILQDTIRKVELTEEIK